jgi:hypothetical protein
MTPFEAVIAAKLIEQGYEVLTSGWPDFCVIKKTGDTTEVRFIEVKGRGDALRPNQKKLHEILRILGMEVEVIQEDVKHRMQYPPLLATGVKIVRKHLTGRPPEVRNSAILFLESELSDGPKSGRYLIRKARDMHNISRSTLFKTAQDMRLARKKYGTEVVWERPADSIEEKKCC